ncbi:MAG: phosphopentomutase [Firmicutes bacterium]|nr:phosphopentomutase [Bacillota bacterium]
MSRAIIIVLDGVGIGELPDAADFGDVGSNTLVHVKRDVKSLELKNMQMLGLGNIAVDKEKNLYEAVSSPKGFYGKAAEKSRGKDTTTGHWEIAGLCLNEPFPTYPNGFPKDVISSYEKAIGTKILANYPASGTQIINELGDEHVKTGYPIVYTSADSVFQIAAHEDVVPLEKLYEMCRKARNDILVGEHAVGRVIARPFTGANGNYTRTKNRKDFSLSPFKDTLLDIVSKNGMETAAVGKIEDIFNNKGITKSVHTTNNTDGIEQTIKYIKESFDGLIFTNLVDYDMLFGHRRDTEGFAKALKEFDDALPRIIDAMRDDDILFITADHGCDPTFSGTDHTREYIFILGYGKKIKPCDIGVRSTYSDIAKTIAQHLKIENDLEGKSFLENIIDK